MSTLTVSNFGPIKEATVEIKKVTVFIGNQGAGKSTLAKLISSFSWLEKYEYRNTTSVKKQESYQIFENMLEYHRIESYLGKQTSITYTGDAFKIVRYITKPDLSFYPTKNNYLLPKITYFPAERNFLSSIKNSKEEQKFNLWSHSLQEFKELFQEVKESIKKNIKLPINNTEIEYNRLNDVLYVKDSGYKIPLSDAASGFQSIVPLFIVADYVNKLLKSEYEMSGGEREKFKKESAAILNNPE
ncbi:MAG: AAA family ATPase [Bacteroidales bacterium]|nr:AAA family ATPase [Bacteroidales bacterium]